MTTHGGKRAGAGRPVKAHRIEVDAATAAKLLAMSQEYGGKVSKGDVVATLAAIVEQAWWLHQAAQSGEGEKEQ